MHISALFNIYKNKYFEAQLLETFGTTDRRALAEIVFNDPYQRKRLEFTSGVHILQQLQQLQAQAASLFIVEMPLLYELGLQQLFNKVICVTAYDGIRIQRIMARDNRTEEQAMAIIKTQLPQRVKSELADKSISNNLSNDVFLAAEVDNLAKWIVSSIK
jgi:dephospho-CoA kinase